MAYNNKPLGLIRDKSYPSEISNERPLGAPRIHCEEENESYGSPLRGSRGESARERFNRALRAGQGFRNEGEE